MLRHFRQLIESAFAKVGLSIIPTWRLNSLPQATHLSRLFELLGVDCVLDVGANVGQYRDFLRIEVGYRGVIISFEPIPENAEILRKRALADPMWKIHEYALGAEKGTATFNIMAASTFSSFLTPDHSETNQFREQNRIENTITVQVNRLDDVVPALRREIGSGRLFLKMDTQGYDLQVIEGGKTVIRDIVALQTEASVTPIYSGMPDYVASIRTLETLGFCVSGFFPLQPERVLRLVEFDCYMVNKQWQIFYSSIEDVIHDPLVALFKRNWMASRGALFRSASITQSDFDKLHPYAEWT